jgi:anti-sigma B factor antagonist
MDIHTETIANARVLQITGDLDAASVNNFEQQCPISFWQISNPVVVDLSGVTFIDSSGVGMLVFLVKRLWAQQCQVSLAGLQGQPARLVTMLRIQQSIPCYDSVQSCLNTLTSQIDGAKVGRL